MVLEVNRFDCCVWMVSCEDKSYRGETRLELRRDHSRHSAGKGDTDKQKKRRGGK